LTRPQMSAPLRSRLGTRRSPPLLCRAPGGV
jgi:hypothetical protein